MRWATRPGMREVQHTHHARWRRYAQDNHIHPFAPATLSLRLQQPRTRNRSHGAMRRVRATARTSALLQVLPPLCQRVASFTHLRPSPNAGLAYFASILPHGIRVQGNRYAAPYRRP